MSISTSLAIAGFSATIILGCYSIYLVFRTQKYPGKITFVKETCVGLFDAFVRNITDLSILYLDKPVGENLVLLKGCLLNTGTKDISPKMIDEQICITLPEGYKWLAVSIVSTSSQVASNASINNVSEIKFDLGLFRCKEHISFEAIAEVPVNTDMDQAHRDPAEALESAMEFRHRIADTQKIDRQEVLPDPRRFKLIIWTTVIQMLFIFILICLVGTLKWLNKIPADINYVLGHEDANSVEVKIFPRNNGNVDLKGIETDYKESIPIETFFNDRKWKPKIVENKKHILIMLVLSVLFLVCLLLLISIFWKKHKDALLKKLLGIRQASVQVKEN